jgi:nucleoside-diphosphate-sugar epimerase
MDMAKRPENKQWTDEVVEHDREVAYARGKAEAERYVYAEAEKMGIAAFGVCPCHVIGPLLSASHQRPWSWQTRIGDMIEGYGHPRMFWNIVDVRDVAETQRLIAESPDNNNGERYNLVATDESGEIRQTELQAIMRKMYPDVAVAGVYREGKWRDGPLSVLEKPITQLGLKPHTVEETIRDNVDSLLTWGLVKPLIGHAGEEQREGNDLGIASKWSPHEYPATDPATRK